eukprot:gene11348-3381_t
MDHTRLARQGRLMPNLADRPVSSIRARACEACGRRLRIAQEKAAEIAGNTRPRDRSSMPNKEFNWAKRKGCTLELFKTRLHTARELCLVPRSSDIHSATRSNLNFEARQQNRQPRLRHAAAIREADRICTPVSDRCWIGNAAVNTFTNNRHMKQNSSHIEDECTREHTISCYSSSGIRTPYNPSTNRHRMVFNKHLRDIHTSLYKEIISNKISTPSLR